MKADRDIGFTAHEFDEQIVMMRAQLCAFRTADWCVLGDARPPSRGPFSTFGRKVAPREITWTIAHTATGGRIDTLADLWRAIVLCEEVQRAFEGVDLADPGERRLARDRMRCARLAALEREVHVASLTEAVDVAWVHPTKVDMRVEG